jgi:hypothetical protein
MRSDIKIDHFDEIYLILPRTADIYNKWDQGHYGFHSFLVVDWFCLFIYLW